MVYKYPVVEGSCEEVSSLRYDIVFLSAPVFNERSVRSEWPDLAVACGSVVSMSHLTLTLALSFENRFTMPKLPDLVAACEVIRLL